MSSFAAAKKVEHVTDPFSQKTLSFYKIPKYERNQIVENIINYTEGDLNKLTPEIAKTAVKAIIISGSIIAAVPIARKLRYGYGLYVKIRKNQLMVFTTVAQLQTMVSARLKLLAESNK